ncbi:hypothetical protein [Vampirovibrio sp.]|uniref:hypothetical protein n=1 Tax=Vampirovibrio sp. TaxID=2717857 RepID=UPI0035931912
MLGFHAQSMVSHQCHPPKTGNATPKNQTHLKPSACAVLESAQAEGRTRSSLARLQQSHLVRDRITDNDFILDREALKKLKPPQGQWITVHKIEQEGMTVERFIPPPKAPYTLTIKAQRISPVSAKKPEYLKIPFDENGETHRLMVIV